MLGLELNGALKNATTIIYRQCIFCSSSSWKSGSTTNAPTQMTLRWSCSHVLVYSLTLYQPLFFDILKKTKGPKNSKLNKKTQ